MANVANSDTVNTLEPLFIHKVFLIARFFPWKSHIYPLVSTSEHKSIVARW
jgi:hypothetical protein